MNNKATEMIDNILENIDLDVYTRGYYLTTEDGTWYEMYVNDNIIIDEEELDGFEGLYIDLEENQITFFVSNAEEIYTFDEMYEILV